MNDPREIEVKLNDVIVTIKKSSWSHIPPILLQILHIQYQKLSPSFATFKHLSNLYSDDFYLYFENLTTILKNSSFFCRSYTFSIKNNLPMIMLCK